MWRRKRSYTDVNACRTYAQHTHTPAEALTLCVCSSDDDTVWVQWTILWNFHLVSIVFVSLHTPFTARAHIICYVSNISTLDLNRVTAGIFHTGESPKRDRFLYACCRYCTSSGVHFSYSLPPSRSSLPLSSFLFVSLPHHIRCSW